MVKCPPKLKAHSACPPVRCLKPGCKSRGRGGGGTSPYGHTGMCGPCGWVFGLEFSWNRVLNWAILNNFLLRFMEQGEQGTNIMPSWKYIFYHFTYTYTHTIRIFLWTIGGQSRSTPLIQDILKVIMFVEMITLFTFT